MRPQFVRVNIDTTIPSCPVFVRALERRAVSLQFFQAADDWDRIWAGAQMDRWGEFDAVVFDLNSLDPGVHPGPMAPGRAMTQAEWRWIHQVIRAC